MKRLITIFLLAISGFASAQYQLNYADIRIGNSNTGKIVLRGSNVQFPFLALGSTTDSVVTIDNGVFKKVPRSQFSGGGSGAVSSVFGRTGDVVALSADYNAFYPLLASTYNNPTWINTLAYSKITGVPAFITTETDPIWTGVSANYRTKTQNDALYYPLTGNPSGFLTSYTETDPLFDTKFAGKTTTGLAEGTNLYFTQGRVSANTDVTANTAARHSAVTIGTANGLSLVGQALSLSLSSSGVTGALSGSDWNTFNSKQNQLVLTTLGTSGTASLIGNTLNIPNYATGGGAGSSALRVPVTLASGATVIPITWATYSATYGVSPTDLSLIELSSTGDRQVFTNWYSDDNGVTYKFDVAPETGSRNFVVVISGGSTVTSGNVTSVTSANGDISVTNSTTTPVLTLNSGTGANQIVKRNGSGSIADLAPYLLSSNAASTYYPLTNPNGYTSNSGTVTNVTSANANISVATGGSTPVLTLNTTITSNTTGNAATASAVPWAGVTGKPTALSQFTNDLPIPTLQQITTSGNISQNSILVQKTNTTIPTLGSGQNSLYLIDSGGNYGTQLGVLGTGWGFLQQARTDGTATAYPYLINPKGGNLLINTETDNGASLQVSGKATVSIAPTNPTDVVRKTELDTKQNQINGTGFVKASGTTVSYDNTSYYPASNPNGYTSNSGTVTSVTSSNANISVATGTTTPILTLNSTITSNTSGNAASASSVPWTGVTSRPTALSQFTNDLPIPNLQQVTTAGNVITNNMVIGSADNVLPSLGAGNYKLFLGNNGNAYGTQFGVIGNGMGYLQQARIDGTATAYSFMLNPLGGNVLIGSTTDNGAYKLQVTGGISATGNVGINGDISASNLASGPYTPSLTAAANNTSPSISGAKYSRVGNIVTVSGNVTINVTAASTNTVVGVALPIPSNFTLNDDVTGTLTALNSYGQQQLVTIANSTSDRIDLSFFSGSTTGANTFYFICQYIIK